MSKYILPAEVIDAVQSLLDTVLVSHHDRQSEETFIECLMCGEWDSHIDDCCIPAVLAWQELP